MKKLLNEIAEVTAGQGAPQGDENYSIDGTPFVKAGNLYDLINGESIDSIQKVNDDIANKYRLKKFPAGTVVFAKSGISCLKSYVYVLPTEAYVVNHLACIVPDLGLSEYLKFYFMHHKPSELIKDSSYPSIRLSDITDIVINLPELSECMNIVKILNNTERVIKIKKPQLLEFDQLIKSRFVEMFNSSFRDKKCYRSIDEICNLIDYRGKTPEKSDSGIPLITAKNVKSNKFDIEPREYIPAENYNSVMTRGYPKINDVLFTTEAPLGNVCRIPDVYDKFCVGQRLITMQPKKDVLTSEYLEMALLSEEFQEEMWRQSSGSTVKGIRSKLLVKIQVPVPDYDSQIQFSRIVQQVDKLKFEVDFSYHNYRNIRTASAKLIGIRL